MKRIPRGDIKEYKRKAARKTALKVKYGLTLNDYDRMVDEQRGVCAICSKQETAKVYGTVKRLAVDHCHQTLKVRGLLCNSCNALLAKIGDNSRWLESALKYLKN